MNTDTVRKFQKTVYAYYRVHGRDLPWRNTHDPYKILVSEIMLQQTQVQRVMEKYREFIREFPTIKALAKATLRRIMGTWQGLGYNRRALFLKKLACVIESQYKGRIPDDRESLMKLPGIGKATSGAFLAFAFNQPHAFIETNIRSVFIHHFFNDSFDVHDEDLIQYVLQTLDSKHPRKWYYALMDYGVHLKNTRPNPSRKSTQYKKQSPFHGSDRQLRGKILKLLLTHPSISSADLLSLLDSDRERARKIVERLLTEKMIRKKGNMLSI